MAKKQIEDFERELTKRFMQAQGFCGSTRPPRKVICQLKKGHKGNHRAIVFWED